MINTRRFVTAAVSVFMLMSVITLYISLSSKTAALRGTLPTVSVPIITELDVIQESVPLGELPGSLEETEPVDEYEPFRAQAHIIAASMTEDEKLYQLFIITPEQLTGYNKVYQAGSATEKALGNRPVGGLIYSSTNLQTAAQTTEMLAKTQEFSKLPLFFGVDEEGGSVARVSGSSTMGFEALPAPALIGATGDTELSYDAGATIGEMLHSLGFNLDFAPVADVLTNPDNTVIGDRSFGSDSALVADMTYAFTEGLRSAGLASSLKHFPGHGGTGTDSHNGYSESGRTLEELRAAEFLPFEAGIAAGADFVMTSHLTAVNIDADYPASLSALITTQLLREELGYDRLIITDALNMGAISQNYGSGEAAVLALEAGADMLLMPEKLDDSIKAIRAALDGGRLTWERIDASIERILLVKLERGIIPPDYGVAGE